MKFKLFFGLVMMFAFSVGMKAQSFLPTVQAVTSVENAIVSLDNGTMSVPNPSQDPTTLVAVSKTAAAAASHYPLFLVELITEIKTANDTQTGYDNLVTRLSADANSDYRVLMLEGAKSFALDLITN